jgi:hypothetical protein
VSGKGRGSIGDPSDSLLGSKKGSRSGHIMKVQFPHSPGMTVKSLKKIRMGGFGVRLRIELRTRVPRDSRSELHDTVWTLDQKSWVQFRAAYSEIS